VQPTGTGRAETPNGGSGAGGAGRIIR